MIGSVLKKYRIMEKVKDGSTGSVWKAENGTRMVAIKIIHDEHAAIPKKKKAFQREGRIQAKLDHQSIVSVIEYVDGKRPFIAMEYFPSEELKIVIQEHPGWLKGRRMTILRKTAEALHYCHQSGILHRDIKPQNILVSEEGDCRLIDFSLASTKMERILTFGRKAHGGTPAYMAPEQIRGAKIDGRADMYALGAVAYEMFTGKQAFSGTSQAALMDAHLKGPVPSAREANEKVPVDLDRLLQRMLAKRPDDRYPDMVTVISEFRKWEQKIG
jgi:serine/threonine-protein kinase